MSIYTEEARRLALCLIKDRPMGMSLAEAGQVILDALGMPAKQAAHPAPAEGDERAAFEAEMRCEEEWGHKNLKRDKHGDYLNSWTGAMWAVWQARAAKASKVQPKWTVEPVAWLYTLEYGASIADRKVSLDQLRYPFGVCGSDYLRVNDDGTSYVRETPLRAIKE